MYQNYCVSDFYKTYEYGLSLIAGFGGMSRPISNVTILDYEIDPMLKDKYYHLNFGENQLTVSTFLVAKDNPGLILEAVKHLISKKTSGLVIKNVYKLPIHESVIRYANSKNFPIFLINSNNIFVEVIVFEVMSKLKGMNYFLNAERTAAAMLNGALRQDEIVEGIRSLNPSAADNYFSIYAAVDELSAEEDIKILYNTYLESRLNIPENSFIPYKSGVFLVCASDKGIDYKSCLQILSAENKLKAFGISNVHSTLLEMGICLKEGLNAAQRCSDSKKVLAYSQLGSLQLILPFAGSIEMQKYKNRILTPIMDYDIETGGSLLKTLSIYIDCNCSIETAAESSGQHKNTIRYRLDKIRDLTNLDYKSFSDMEQLSLAVKIHSCCE